MFYLKGNFLTSGAVSKTEVGLTKAQRCGYVNFLPTETNFGFYINGGRGTGFFRAGERGYNFFRVKDKFSVEDK